MGRGHGTHHTHVPVPGRRRRAFGRQHDAGDEALRIPKVRNRGRRGRPPGRRGHDLRRHLGVEILPEPRGRRRSLEPSETDAGVEEGARGDAGTGGKGGEGEEVRIDREIRRGGLPRRGQAG